jgi:putative SOS response-associated peptidase YedK
MCGRFVITSPPAALRQIFGFVEQPNFPPRHNIAPTQPIPVVIVENGARHFRLMRWGLIPSWVKDPRKITLMINARSETVETRPAFKNAVRRRRCLIPADGYYEWRVSAPRKRPFFIRRRDCRPFALAGLVESWIGPNGEELDTVAIVTAPASRDLAVLHCRVPVAIRDEDFARWLDCSADDAASVMGLLGPPEAGEFTWHEVSTRVNHADNDDPQLIQPITEEQRIAEDAPKTAKRSTPGKVRPPAIDDGQGSLF